MQVAVHWQDADSSSANAVAAVSLESDIMVAVMPAVHIKNSLPAATCLHRALPV